MVVWLNSENPFISMTTSYFLKYKISFLFVTQDIHHLDRNHEAYLHFVLLNFSSNSLKLFSIPFYTR